MAKSDIKIEVVVVNNPDSHPAIERVLERPPLFVAMAMQNGEIVSETNGVFLAFGSGRVLVRAITNAPYLRPMLCEVGFRGSTKPKGPAYTGPIDDEMMANILIYGG